MKLKNVIFESASFLIIVLAQILIFSNLFFIAGLSLSFYILPMSLCYAGLYLFYKSKNIMRTLTTVSLAIFIAIVSLLLATIIYDTSWDGQGYHQETVYLLKNGWNPIYQPSGAFRIWVNLYQNGNEIIQANVYLLTNKIEGGKMINLLFVYIGFVMVLRFLDELKIHTYTKFLLAVIIILNPVVFTQIFTYYVDGNWYLTLVISLAALLTYISQKKKKFLLIFILSSVIFCSLKFSSTPIFVVFSAFAITYCYFSLKLKLVKPFLVIGIFNIVCNIHPFSSNIRNGEHILYPFAGTNKIDIINQNIPKVLMHKNRFERLFISLFSETGDQNFKVSDSTTLKVPFTAKRDELFINHDTRIGGFGFLFSGLLTLSFFLGVYLFFTEKNNRIRTRMLVVFLSLIISILINPASWWARLSPQIWLLPLTVLIFAVLSGNKWRKLSSDIILTIFVVNIFLPTYISYRKLKDDQKIMNDFVRSVDGKIIIFDLSSRFAFQQYYLKFKEKNIIYKIQPIKDKSNIAPFTPDVYYKIQ